MITRETVTRYTAGDGSKHDTLEAAQEQDLVVLLSDELAEKLGGIMTVSERVPDIAKAILARSKHVVDILTTTPSSLPKARKIWGGSKPRKPRVVAEQPVLPGTAESVAQSA